MKITIVSHSTIDLFMNEEQNYEQIGGPIYYGGIIAKNLRATVHLQTKFGHDFLFRNKLIDHNFLFENKPSNQLTTKFKINLTNMNELFLENFCEPITSINYNSDITVIDPVFHEIDPHMLEEIPHTSIVFLDPRGFLRQLDSQGRIFLSKSNIDLVNISIIKLTDFESLMLTGHSGVNAMRYLQKLGAQIIILFRENEILLLDKHNLYTIIDKSFKCYNAIGAMDIFNSAFCCTYIKEHDIIWALCFGGGAMQAALTRNELNITKFPTRNIMETNAAYFYNLLRFTQI